MTDVLHVADAQASSLAALRTLAVCPSLSTFKFMGWQPNTSDNDEEQGMSWEKGRLDYQTTWRSCLHPPSVPPYMRVCM